MRNLMTLCLACFALVGCSGGADLPRVAADGTPLAEGFDPPPQPDNALQLISPILKDFPPGGNTEFCYYTKTILKSEIIIKAGQGYQTPGGHHVVVYWTQKPRSEQIHECTEDDMTSLHALSGGGAEGGNGIINSLPEGTAFHVPAGAQLVMNVHMLNATQKPIDGQAVANIFYGDPSATSISSFFVTGTSIDIAPGETKSYTASCAAKYPLKVVRMVGHMHEWGTRNVVTMTQGSGNAKVYYDKPGAMDFSYDPPAVDYPVAAPLEINVGDKIAVTCTWNNTTGKPLRFPTEMCAVFGYVLGNEPERGCADGEWNN